MITFVNSYEALLDTCVLAPMPLADTLLRLAEEPSIFVPRWSRHILEELHSVLCGKWGYTETQADRRIAVMRTHFEEAEITGYECIMEGMTNHPKDRHVLAAAVRGNVHALVTLNLKDFPSHSVQPYGIEVLSPDDFLLHQFHLNSSLVFDKIGRQGHAHPQGLAGLLERLGQVAPSFTQLLHEEAA